MKLNRSHYFLLFVCLLSFLVTIVLWFSPPQKLVKQEILLRPLSVIPVLKNPNLNIQEAWQDLTLSAEAVYALDLASGTLLYEKNAKTALYPASTTKILTALVVREYYPLDKILTVDANNGETRVIGNSLDFYEGEQLRVRDLLAALLIFSANDAAYVLADNYPGGLDAFMSAMNQKALDLKLKTSHFINPAGLDSDGQQASAYDLTILARELLKDDYLRQLVATTYLEIESLNLNSEGKAIWKHQLYSTNQLLGSLAGVKGVKTGTTDLAGQVLVTLIEREGKEILIALMKSEDRYNDTQKLIAWILNNYQWTEFEEYLFY